MIVYRISRRSFIHDLSGTGSSLYPGRWHNKNTFVLYTAATPSLALLETVVHLHTIAPLDFFMATIQVPNVSFTTLSLNDLPAGWSASPPNDNLKAIGDQFVAARKYLALKIPSAIMPEDFNYLLNPAHPKFSDVIIQNIKSIAIDSRLIRGL